MKTYLSYQFLKRSYQKFRGNDEKIIRYFPIRQLTPKSTEKLRTTLSHMTKKDNEHALLVGINMHGGDQSSVIQAEIVGGLFRRKANELGIPLITYAEDYALHGGFHLLMHGDTKLANPVS